MTVGQKLKSLRIAKNLSQQEAANKYGCSRIYLNGVENDRIKIGYHAIRKFAELYGVDVNVITQLFVIGD